MSNAACHICEEVTSIMDEHHVWARSAGGEAGPTVYLCSRCHSGIHRQALNILSKKAAPKAFFTESQMEKARPLIRYLVMAIRESMENGKANQRTNLVVRVDSDLIKLLHIMKADAGMTNLSNFCEMVLKSYIAARL